MDVRGIGAMPVHLLEWKRKAFGRRKTQFSILQEGVGADDRISSEYQLWWFSVSSGRP